MTFASGTTGAIGVISAANSLVGSTAGDDVGAGVITLTNGNYVVASPTWHNGTTANAGAVTLCNGTTGLFGVVSTANSLVGATAGDEVGQNAYDAGLTALANGNFVVVSTAWHNSAGASVGAVTLDNGTTGTFGVVSPANSLVGSTSGDEVGSGGVTALTNGNYVVRSLLWQNSAGTTVSAVTFGNGVTGTVGVVSPVNSLVGSAANDSLGSFGVTALPNGNYVVLSPRWDNGAVVDAGAATFGSGTTGVDGVVSAANSLVGSSANDTVGTYVLTVLTNGNYVVVSPEWSNGALKTVGAVTFGSEAVGVVGRRLRRQQSCRF